MDVMVAVMPFSGHVIPARQAVGALVEAGHEVRVYVGASYRAAFEQVGARVVPWEHAPDFDEHQLTDTFPRVGRSGPLGLLANVEHVFLRTGTGQVADLTAEHARRPWDVLLADSMSIGAALTAERLGTPWATLSVLQLNLPSRHLPPPGIPVEPAMGPAGRVRDLALHSMVNAVSTPLRRAYRQVRLDVGLPARGRRLAEAWFSPSLVLALGVPALEPPRPDFPAHVHFLGTFPLADTVTDVPDWWDDLLTDPRPVVHVTQGTFNVDPDELIRPALTALAGRDVLVVATTGASDQARLPFAVPDNARVAGRVPYPGLLTRTDVMITNGGWGGVLAALAHGIPLIVAGSELDKPAIAATVARSGAGINLRTGRPSPEAIGRALDRINTDPSIRQHAQRLGEDFADRDTAGELVELLGQLASTGSPVLRRHHLWCPPPEIGF